MKTVVIRECSDKVVEADYELNLRGQNIKDCMGCWTCWWSTPGRCVFKELDAFYRAYINADRAIFFAKVSRGFVSGEMKTLFDRMIPLFMPHTTMASGESMHLRRYDKYPDIEFYYEGEFESEEARQVYEAFVNRVFYMFLSEHIIIKSISECHYAGGSVCEQSS